MFSPTLLRLVFSPPNMDFLIDQQSCDIATASDCLSSKAEQVWSPRERLLNEAWERRRGHITRSRSITAAKQASQPCKRSMLRSISLASGLADAAASHPGRAHITSLTDDDFEELKGCIELGFAFVEESIPELAHILPALPACYALSSSFKHGPHLAPSSTWKLFKPDDHAHDVKEQLRHWAQAVACNVRICYQDEQYFQEP